MGRYDKIRYWNGSSWVQPGRIRVWNGSSWTDYGANDSSNTNSIYVWNGSSWVRKTLNKTSHYVGVDHYLQYSGGAKVSIVDGYQFYNAKYEFEVQPDAAGNYMLFETSTSNSSNYVRFGLYVDGSTFYAYGKSRYNSGTAYEANTKSKGSMSAGVRYRITYQTSGTALTVYNYSTGATWSISASKGTFYNWSCSTSIFEGCVTTGRNLYGKVWSVYLQGCKKTTTSNNVTYNMNSNSGGSTTLNVTSYSSSGGVSPGYPTHYGTLVDPSYTYYTWD